MLAFVAIYHRFLPMWMTGPASKESKNHATNQNGLQAAIRQFGALSVIKALNCYADTWAYREIRSNLKMLT